MLDCAALAIPPCGLVSGQAPGLNGGGAGPLATICCESGQARKGAAVAADSGAGVWLVVVASNSMKRWSMLAVAWAAFSRLLRCAA